MFLFKRKKKIKMNPCAASDKCAKEAKDVVFQVACTYSDLVATLLANNKLYVSYIAARGLSGDFQEWILSVSRDENSSEKNQEKFH